MKCIDPSARLGYSALGCQCRLNNGGTLFRRTRYQQGSLVLEARKRGSAVWVYRWWERDINGKPVRRKLQIGSSEQYQTESAAQAAADALRLTINNPSNRRNLRQTTVSILWEHYCREELPLKHWRARQCETSTSPPVLVTRTSETWTRETRISRPVACVSGWSVRDTSRRARRLALHAYGIGLAGATRQSAEVQIKAVCRHGQEGFIRRPMDTTPAGDAG